MRARVMTSLATWGLTTLAAFPVLAADNIPQQEYNKYIDKHRTIQSLDSSLFGEQINLRDGGVLFRVTDAELPGNGPPIRITRTFKLRENNHFVETTGTGIANGWMLEVPRLKTITNNTSGITSTSVRGWQVPGSNKNLRCSNFAHPGDLTFTDPVKYWQPFEWWSGYQLVDGDGNETPLLGVTSLNPMPGFKAVTTTNWRFECLTSLANQDDSAGITGEGFKGFAPDGTVYWFNYLVYGSADNVTKPYGGTPMSASARSTPSGRPNARDAVTTLAPVNDVLVRRHAMLLVTKIEDRFGNKLDFAYTGGRLDSITASDGRVMTISAPETVGATTTIRIKFNPGVAGAERTWTYATTTTTTTTSTVTLPDSSYWTYNFSDLLAANLPATSTYKTGMCGINTNNTGSSVSGTATSPSGVTGTFNFTLRRFGRSYVYKECQDPDGDGDGFAFYPADWFSFALTSRSFSGPGITSGTWNYTYSPAYASWTQDCGGGCTSEVWTDATAPDGTRQRAVFSNRWGATDGVLVREETYNSSSVLMRSVNHEYGATAGGAWSVAWPFSVGDDMQDRTNKDRTETWHPASKHETVQQGRTFTWQVPSTCGTAGLGDTAGTTPCFDKFARPTKVVKASSP